MSGASPRPGTIADGMVFDGRNWHPIQTVNEDQGEHASHGTDAAEMASHTDLHNGLEPPFEDPDAGLQRLQSRLAREVESPDAPPPVPGWRFLEDGRLLKFSDGERWIDEILLPPQIINVTDGDLKKFLKKSGVARGDRERVAAGLRQRDLSLRARALCIVGASEYLDALVIAARDGFQRVIYQEEDVVLVESRKGARVSVRESSSSSSSSGGSVGYKGVRVGGSSGTSSSYSRTVSYPAPDQLTPIDKGRFTLTLERMTFSGAHFTRNIGIERIADMQHNFAWGELMISPTAGQKTMHLLNLSPVAIFCMLYFRHMTQPEARQFKSDPEAYLAEMISDVPFAAGDTTVEEVREFAEEQIQSLRDLGFEVSREISP